MAYKITLGNPSRVTRRTPDAKEEDGGATHKININRSTYQYLGSLVKNKKLLELYNNNQIPNEYRRVLDELNDLFIKVNYPSLGLDIVVEPGIVELDEWLGNLGIIQEYPYNKDSVDIPVWIPSEALTEVRVLIDKSDNTYLTDSSGTEVLVRYI